MVLSIKLWLPVNSPDLLARWRSQSFGEGAKQVKVSVVEELCLPLSLETPWWCNGVYNFCLWLSRFTETRCPIVHSKPLSRQGFEQLFLNWSFNFSRGSWHILTIWLEIWRIASQMLLLRSMAVSYGQVEGFWEWNFVVLAVKDQQKPSKNDFQGGHSEGASCQVEQNNAELRAALDRVG